MTELVAWSADHNPEPWTGDAWHFRIEPEDTRFVNQRERSTKGQTDSASGSLMLPARPVR